MVLKNGKNLTNQLAIRRVFLFKCPIIVVICIALLYNTTYAYLNTTKNGQNSIKIHQIPISQNTHIHDYPYKNDSNILYIADLQIFDPLPNDVPPQQDSLLKMQQNQIDLIKKEFRANPAPYDTIYYKQRENQKQIQKDSTLKIKPDSTPEIEEISETNSHEFIINYTLKLIDDVPYGEKYNISTPLNPLQLYSHYTHVKTCEITTKEKFIHIKYYPHYTKMEMQASIRKQTQYLLYNLLQKYKADVLECLMLQETYLDDRNTTINLESRTHTITKVRSYILVNFNSGILTLEIFSKK